MAVKHQKTPAQALAVVEASPPALALPAALQQLGDEARGYADAGMSANTRRAYEGDWRDFTAWCAEAGFPAMPADGRTVALYLTARAGTVTVATLARRLAAIRTAHKQDNQTIANGGSLDQVWAGIRRTHGRPPRPKRALVTDDLRKALAALPNSTAGLRDRALLLIGFGAALRRSELAAITLPGDGAGDVRAYFVAGGMEIHIDRAKADQEGRGAIVGIPLGSRLETCAVRALQDWLTAAKITAGPVFRSVDRWGNVGSEPVTPYAVALIVKAAAERIGLDPEAFAGHSLRSGLATSAAANDAPADVIMNQMRHARFETTRRYIRDGERFKRNAAGLAGL